ncbi:BZ3500_MvSof-1268-A1-R1_Chr3-3g06465 [Microbotryum saponariae]|uniref:BZ3500_MvSof-1268-A1-R1_Chr3-3g06465 protein n=1 Tax=Microbotryum saponariae TaxID=289078 RepID=A0A2X0LNY2_9BASI|nr:BZ3500_MvSof-1268-A1-R1_Chr3-3g06465 [Microbotryum saponariae]SDA04432.1 BZ3501_MvSof-1269-A2-R1_Chr3-2g06152 [Microbotryum saponariae]
MPSANTDADADANPTDATRRADDMGQPEPPAWANTSSQELAAAAIETDPDPELFSNTLPAIGHDDRPDARALVILSPRQSPSPTPPPPADNSILAGLPRPLSITGGHAAPLRPHWAMNNLPARSLARRNRIRNNPVESESESESESEIEDDNDGEPTDVDGADEGDLTMFVNSLRTGEASRDRRRSRIISEDSFPPFYVDFDVIEYNPDGEAAEDGEQEPALRMQPRQREEQGLAAEDGSEQGWQGWEEFERHAMAMPPSTEDSGRLWRVSLDSLDVASVSRATELTRDCLDPISLQHEPVDIRRLADAHPLPRGGANLARTATIGRQAPVNSQTRTARNSSQPTPASSFWLHDSDATSYSFSWTRTRTPEEIQRSPSPHEVVEQPPIPTSTSDPTIMERAAMANYILRYNELRTSSQQNSYATDNSWISDAAANLARLDNMNAPTRTGPDARRTTEDRAQTIGQAMRKKKDCWLVYCGQSSHGSSGPLPSGWHWHASSTKAPASGSPSGCGALVCARGLVEAPKKVFDRSGRGELEESIASDLPPCSSAVGEMTGRMSWNTRGVAGCKGCATTDLSCRSCGNLLGYRVVNACTPCKSALAAPVTGLLWHYRRRAVTLLPRVGVVVPSPSIDLSQDHSASLPTVTPLYAQELISGSHMKWDQLPHAQIDFEDGLVGEPSEWYNPETDNSWLVTMGSTTRNKSTGHPSGETVQHSDVELPALPSLYAEAAQEEDAGVAPARDSLFSPFSPPPVPSPWRQLRDHNAETSDTPGNPNGRVGLHRSGAIRRLASTANLSSLTNNGRGTVRPRDDDDEGDAQAGEGRRVRRRLVTLNRDADNLELDRLTEVAGYGAAFVGRQKERRKSDKARQVRQRLGRRSGALVGR